MVIILAVVIGLLAACIEIVAHSSVEMEERHQRFKRQRKKDWLLNEGFPLVPNIVDVKSHDKFRNAFDTFILSPPKNTTSDAEDIHVIRNYFYGKRGGVSLELGPLMERLRRAV